MQSEPVDYNEEAALGLRLDLVGCEMEAAISFGGLLTEGTTGAGRGPRALGSSRIGMKLCGAVETEDGSIAEGRTVVFDSWSGDWPDDRLRFGNSTGTEDAVGKVGGDDWTKGDWEFAVGFGSELTGAERLTMLRIREWSSDRVGNSCTAVSTSVRVELSRLTSSSSFAIRSLNRVSRR